MPTASEHLAQYGVSTQQARDFIYNNLSSPQTIYQVAAQYGVSFDMLAELYGQGVNGQVVKSFFGQQGMATEGDAPTWDDDYLDGDYDTMYGRLDLDLDDVLNLSEDEIAQSDWSSLIDNYTQALANFDWNEWGQNISAALDQVDWVSWAESFNELANGYAQDESWLTQLNGFVSNWTGGDIDDLFEDWQLEDTESDIIDGQDFDFDYSDYLSQLGLSMEELSPYLENLLESYDWSNLAEQLQNFDWSEYVADLGALYENYGLNNSSYQDYLSALQASLNNISGASNNIPSTENPTAELEIVGLPLYELDVA